VILRLLAKFSYVAVFGLLVAGGVGVPVPEEVVQLGAGFLAKQGAMALWPALAVTAGGILLGDYILFRLGRSHGARVMASRHLRRFFTPERRAWVERHFENHDFLTVMVARLVSPFRLPVFASAGAMGVRTGTFLLADGLAALLSVPLVFGLGYLFAAHLAEVKRSLHEAEAVGAMLLVGLGGAWSAVRRKRGARLVLIRRGAGDVTAPPGTPPPPGGRSRS
jgi:membrane protein DedA with SNARE-associated domain